MSTTRSSRKGSGWKSQLYQQQQQQQEEEEGVEAARMGRAHGQNARAVARLMEESRHRGVKYNNSSNSSRRRRRRRMRMGASGSRVVTSKAGTVLSRT
jgi:hypothetical protein